MKLKSQELQVCNIQGKLFELSGKKGYSSENFIRAFMRSKVAESLDARYDRLQWAGEEYLLEELSDEMKLEYGKTYKKESLYWIGYTYRYWHYYTGESSKEIFQIADGEIMDHCWLGYHTYDTAMAIDELKEDFNNRQNENLRPMLLK